MFNALRRAISRRKRHKRIHAFLPYFLNSKVLLYLLNYFNLVCLHILFMLILGNSASQGNTVIQGNAKRIISQYATLLFNTYATLCCTTEMYKSDSPYDSFLRRPELFCKTICSRLFSYFSQTK
jgi:hypothetical protein